MFPSQQHRKVPVTEWLCYLFRKVLETRLLNRCDK